MAITNFYLSVFLQLLIQNLISKQQKQVDKLLPKQDIWKSDLKEEVSPPLKATAVFKNIVLHAYHLNNKSQYNTSYIFLILSVCYNCCSNY